MAQCAKTSRFMDRVVGSDNTANHDAELGRLALSKSVKSEAVNIGRDDVALLDFTSGTTGIPKATMHFHRDLIIIASSYAKEVLQVTPDDIFVGSLLLAFTFGLGGLAIFPLRFGATEMLHIFISNKKDDAKPACTGLTVTGYEVKIIDADMNKVPRGKPGRLAVRGPTGCRYLADDRQQDYVRDAWNLTSDSFWQDAKGYFHFIARTDDMIVSSRYNIASPDVEQTLLKHKVVLECAVIGAPDAGRSMLIEAYVVLHDEVRPNDKLVLTLQEHVKAMIAPYKYPRRIHFLDELPKTQTGKIQRFRLKGNG